MSTQRGNSEKKKAPKYANKMGFRNDLHDTNRRTKAIREIEVTGCCDKCTKVIEWKIKYKKYKPLTVPKKCVKCEQKTVLNAYYIVCQPCAKRDDICGKCADDLKKSNADIEETTTKMADDISKVDISKIDISKVDISKEDILKEDSSIEPLTVAKKGWAKRTSGDGEGGEGSSKEESSIDENDSLDTDSIKTDSDEGPPTSDEE